MNCLCRRPRFRLARADKRTSHAGEFEAAYLDDLDVLSLLPATWSVLGLTRCTRPHAEQVTVS